MTHSHDTPNGDKRQLDPKHRELLECESGISPEVIAERGYFSVHTRREFILLGFKHSQWAGPGLVLPLWATDGSNPLYVYRPDDPLVEENGTIRKYILPAGSKMRLDMPPRCLENPQKADVTLCLTEGQRKADALASKSLTAIDVLGVWNFKGKNEHGTTTFLADWDYVGLNNRTVLIIYDSDSNTKPAVQQALKRIADHLKRKKANVQIIQLPPGKGSKKDRR
jgi:hypothetical protein